MDGKSYSYKKVWLASVMNGKFYGGGMMPTPNQDRLREDGKISVLVFHDVGKLRALMIFPSIFSGTASEVYEADDDSGRENHPGAIERTDAASNRRRSRTGSPGIYRFQRNIR